MLILKDHRGFTLVELLVVIAIIGVLSTMVTAGVRRSKASANDARRMSDITALQRAIELAYVDSSDYTVVLGSACAVPGVRVSQCNGTLRNFLPEIGNLRDINPNNNQGCATLSQGCDFSIVVAPTATSYRVGFWLEGGMARLAEGAHYLDPDGVQ